MSFRIEEKLLIDSKRLVDFKKYLSKKNAVQIYKPRKIQSLYFENDNYEMYSDSIEGLTPRKKIRIRNYPDMEDDKLYLETKISSVEGRYKTRSVVDKSKFNYLKEKGILDSQYGFCKPCLYVSYDREYFKFKDVRISIDNNINFKVYKKKNYQRDYNTIVELKTSIKKNLDKLIEDFPFQRIRFSKFCNGIEKIILK
jgi:SPX domain protein involved in polyphosphate accumulation